ncbi:hypothetical protein Y032_0039g116 [Ancylostoma ceylanicum]|nr:hypothetical protein Y032_0039g116 [Ancylostoma ceylanicum]
MVLDALSRQLSSEPSKGAGRADCIKSVWSKEARQIIRNHQSVALRTHHHQTRSLWTEEVRTKVREKKRSYHLFLDNKTEDNWSCREAKRSAKKVVAAAKAAHYDEVCKKLDSKDGERLIYRLAKSRKRQADDVENFYGVSDEQGVLLMDRKMAMQRWRDYFEKVSIEEFAHPPVPEVPPTFGPVEPITIEETLAHELPIKKK